MRVACWVNTERIQTHTLNIQYLFFSTATMFMRTRLNVTLYVYCLCLNFIIFRLAVEFCNTVLACGEGYFLQRSRLFHRFYHAHWDAWLLDVTHLLWRQIFAKSLIAADAPDKLRGLQLRNFCYQLQQVNHVPASCHVFSRRLLIKWWFAFCLFSAFHSCDWPDYPKPSYITIYFLRISASTWNSSITPKWRQYLPNKRGAETQKDTNIWCFVDFPEWRFATLVCAVILSIV
jgi:hypothetical protein